MLQRAGKILKEYYGYNSFRRGQEDIILSIMQGRDILGIMPTGGGKSICFQIPALMLSGITLVISPLISLMKDQVDALNALGIKGTFINSSLEPYEVEERINQAARGHYKLLYLAPERLESQQFLNWIKSLPISLLAIDEAHCVSQWGHDFRPSYRSISSLIAKLSQRPVVAAFTATATADVRLDIVRLLSLDEPEIYVAGFNRENLSFAVVRGENKREFLVNFLKNNPGQAGIIYGATRKEVDNLYSFLAKKGFSVGRYHAGLSDGERKSSQEMFSYDDIRIMVATNAFGMGIDKSNVRFVIHNNMPKNMEAYYQEAGRAGRDDEKGQCILLFSPQDIQVQKFLIEQNILAPERKANEYKKLQIMVDYCHTPRCLRKYILQYFGEENHPDACGNCSSCNDNSELSDISLESQKIFSCILRMREQFGITLVADVLRGSRNKKVLQYGFNNLSTYGLMKELTGKQIADLINLLIAEGYLTISEGQYPVVKLKPRAALVLKNKEQVLQRVTIRKQAVKVDNSLFESLRNLRKEISLAANLPPYIIFPDSTLREMSEHYPTDKGAMLSIKGVGHTKFELYGRQFLDLINEYVQENNIAPVLDKQAKEAGVADINNSSQEKEVPSHVISFNMYKGGCSIKDIVSQRKLKSITIQNHLIRCGLEGHDLSWDDFIPQRFEALILEKIEELGASSLKNIKDALADEVDYMAIRAVIGKYKDRLVIEKFSPE